MAQRKDSASLAGRKLTRQQAFRIKKVQAERLARAQRKIDKLEETTDSDSIEGVVVTRHGATAEVAALEGDSFGEPTNCYLRANLGEVVCGDRVSFRVAGDEGVVTAVQPRTRRLARPSPYGGERVMAANIDQLLIVGALMPLPGPDTIDRFLIAAALTDIEAVIVLNKIDLAAQSPELDELRDQLGQLYARLGHRVIETSVKNPDDLNALRETLNGRTSALVGQSGVGKSSLVQALLPDETLRVGDLDERGQGKHTTSQGRLYRLAQGGWLIDSPGIRAFGLSDLHREQVLVGFPDVAAAAETCKFRDCQHDAEPGCGVHAALDCGALSELRYDNYLALAAEAAAPKHPRKGRER